MFNINIIHLKHDVGRYAFVHPLLNMINFHAKIFNAIGLHNENVVLRYKNRADATLHCTLTIISLLTEHLEKHDDKHLIIFEDDIIVHKNFMNYWNSIVCFVKEKKWKLLYLGVSNKLQNNFGIHNFPSKKIYTGGYGIIIHKNIVRDVLSLCKKYHDNPHDIAVYGLFQQKYPKECYVHIPNLVIANVESSNIRPNKNQINFSRGMNWNLHDYTTVKQIQLFIVCNGNMERIHRFRELVTMFQPKVRPIYIFFKNIPLSVIPFVDILESHTIINEFNDLFKLCTGDYFIVTDISINWTTDLPNNFFSEIDKKMNSVDMIKCSINSCPRCHSDIRHNIYCNIRHDIYCDTNDILERDLAFLIINININININKSRNKNKVYKMNMPFYSTNTCCEISDNKMHRLCHYDFADDIDSLSRPKSERRKNTRCDRLNDIEKWKHLFLEWKNKYIEDIITKTKNCNELAKILRIKKIRHMRKNGNQFMIIFGWKELIYLFGIYRVKVLRSILELPDQKINFRL